QTRSFQWFRPQARHGYDFHRMIFVPDLKPVGPDESKIDQKENQKNYDPVAAGHRAPVQLSLGQKAQLKIVRHSHTCLQTKGTRAWGHARARSLTYGSINEG